VPFGAFLAPSIWLIWCLGNLQSDLSLAALFAPT
jgi:hypothetical protein